LRLGLESTSHQMMWIGDNILSYGRFVDPAETIAAIQAVTADDIRQLAADGFRPERMSAALITPVGDAMTADSAAAVLERF